MDENLVFQPNKSDQDTNNALIQPKPDSLSIIEQVFDKIANVGKIIIGLIVVLLIFVIFTRFLIPILIPIFTSKKTLNATLTYWGVWEDKSTMQRVIADFEKENPNIKVDYIKQDQNQYRERLITRINNGSGPDIFRFHNTWLPQIYNILLPLPGEVVQKKDFQKWFYKVSAIDLAKNGAIYGIPFGIDTLSLFTNTEIFQAAGAAIPTTWEDFGKTAKALTVKDESGKIKTAGAALGTFDNITHAPDIISLLFLQNGVDLLNLSSTSQNAVDAIVFYTQFAQGEDNVWDSAFDPSLLAFAKGNLAMYFGYSWDIFNIKALNPSLVFEVAPVPVLSNRPLTIASYWAEGISLKSKHQKEAMLFLKYLTRKETEQKLFAEQSKTRAFGEPYARTDLAESLKDNKLIYPFVSQASFASSSFFASDTFDNGLNSQMNNYLGNAIRSVFVNTSPQTAVETLSQGVTQVLGQYAK